MIKIQKKTGGFTIIELMVVISIILILISIAVPIYNQSILRAKEAVLRQDLFAMRSAIDQYTMDKAKAPFAPGCFRRKCNTMTVHRLILPIRENSDS